MQAHDKSDGEKRALIQTKLPGFVDGILSLIPGCKSSVLGMLLEALTTIITVRSKVVIFLHYSSDLHIPLFLVRSRFCCAGANKNRSFGYSSISQIS